MKSKFFFLVLLCLSTISIAQQIQFPKFEIDSIGYSDLGSMEGSVSIEYINKISAEVIYDYAFAGSKYLTSITIPEKVRNIGMYTFSYCPILDTINYNAVNATISF